jgi:hypothetical protein
MPAQRGSTDLPHFVHERELETIDARRRAAFGENAPLPGDMPGGAPSVRRGLIGLAISGGGIRSSTLSLGVIQALARRGLFRWFDYVSTVSGGGYTGSMISSLLRDAGATEAPLLKHEGQEESAALQHLRNGSNYLSPGGLDDAARLPAVVLRGLLLNLLQLLPLLMLATLATELIHESRYRLLGLGRSVTGWLELPFAMIPGDYEWLVMAVLVPWIVYRLLILASKGAWAQRNRQEKTFGWLLLIAGAALVAIPLLAAVHWAIQQSYVELEHFIADRFTAKLWFVALAVSVGTYVLVKASEGLSTLLGKAALYVAAVLGPGPLFALYLLLVVAQVDSPFLHGSYPELAAPGTDQSTTMVRLSPALRAELVDKGVVYGANGPAPVSTDLPYDVPALGCSSVGSEGAWHLARPADRLLQDLTDDGICQVANRQVEEVSVEMGQPSYRILRHEDGVHEIWGLNLHLGGPAGAHTLMPDSTFLILAVFLLVFNYLYLNVNMSSLHGFYRDRLSKLYLFRVSASGEVEQNDEQKLSDLNQAGSHAPYHIINTTLNMQGDVVESARGRSSDFFFFSKHFCGGPHAWYCDTADLERMDPRIDLGTAMAISAAAAAPNMGSTTKKSLVFILTMLNFRLGYWVPNPLFVKDLKAKPRIPWTYRPGVLRLFSEATGSLTADTPMVNVSDGGHLENLAVYELLRRRCRVIVAIDGEADPELHFHGLVTLMRIAKIDLGVTITVDLDRLTWNEDRLAGAHYGVGEIDYGADGRGHLIYVKSTVDGDENPYIRKYRADHPDFPHETTADQFFDEIQFEAYRALGDHIGSMVTEGFETVLEGMAKEEGGVG